MRYGEYASLYFYRRRDQKAADTLNIQNSVMYPVKILKASQLRQQVVQYFSMLKLSYHDGA